MTGVKTDCIYFQVDPDDKNYIICKSTGHYCEKGTNICSSCRPWDNYIPESATKEQKEYAQKRQHMSYEELIKTDYYDYFDAKNMI